MLDPHKRTPAPSHGEPALCPAGDRPDLRVRHCDGRRLAGVSRSALALGVAEHLGEGVGERAGLDGARGLLDVVRDADELD